MDIVITLPGAEPTGTTLAELYREHEFLVTEWDPMEAALLGDQPHMLTTIDGRPANVLVEPLLVHLRRVGKI